jgi:hypothetical protein
MIRFLENGGKLDLITCEIFKESGMHFERQKEVEKKIHDMALKGKSKRNLKRDTLIIKHLAWGLISEHIKLNEKGCGVYMKRIGKSSIVSPIWVNNKKDYKSLDKMFEYYWRKAKKV